MNSRYHSFSIIRKFFKKQNNLKSSCWIQTGRRLIQKYDTRISDELYTYWSPLPFSPTDPFDEGISDFYIGTCRKSQINNQILYNFVFLILRNVHSYITGELEAFSRSQSSQKGIFLHYIPNLFRVRFNRRN